MVYTKPIRTTGNGKRIKRLTIGNTDKYHNYNSITNAELNSMVPVNRTDIKKILKSVANKIAKGKVDTNTYRYDKPIDSAMDSALESNVIDLISLDVNFIYHCKVGHVSDNVLDTLSRSSGDTAVLFTLGNDKDAGADNPWEFNKGDKVNNVAKAYEATKVIFEVPIVLPDMNAVTIIKAFEPYATNIDEVQIDIPPLTEEEITYGEDTTGSFIVDLRKDCYYIKPDGLWYCYPKNKYTLYKNIERAFSDWGTYVTMICTDNADKAALDKLVLEDKKGGGKNNANKKEVTG